MRKTVLIIFVLLVAAYGFYHFRAQNRDGRDSAGFSHSADSSQNLKNQMTDMASDPEALGVPASSLSTISENAKPEVPPLREHLSSALAQIGPCFHIRPIAPEEAAKMTTQTFHDYLVEEFGDLIFQEIESTTTDILLPSGEMRRLSITHQAQNGLPERHLKYYQIKRDGSMTELPLGDGQDLNPSETLIASLESDGEIVGRASSKNIYLQGGVDVHVAESQGVIYSLKVVTEGRTFDCPQTSHCTCL